MIKLLYIDLFCGAGGTSTGVEKAQAEGDKCAKVIACVNHDKNAIASHSANHPDALHFTEDIRTLELSLLVSHVNKMRTMYPDASVVLWASLECTNFSKAKGGQARDADSRTLAEHLFRYIEAIRPNYVTIENVVEFMAWGDVDANGKPLSMDRGRLYLKWVKNVRSYGYDYDYRILNAADFGAYTSRKRFFGQFALNGLPIAWPEPTHSKNGSEGFFKQKRWKAVKDVLDLSDEGTSIFTREKPLSEKTLERIYAGLIRFVAGGTDKFIQQRNSGDPGSKVFSIDKPARTITTTGGNQELVTCNFLSAYYGNGDNVSSTDIPAPTVTTKDRLALINPRFLCSYNFKDAGKSIDQPCPTILTKDRLALISPFFVNYYSGGGQHTGINGPSPAVTTNPKQRLIKPVFIDQQFGQSKPAGIDQPCGALTGNPKYNLVSCKPWIMNTNFNNIGSSIDFPAPVITANRKWHYLVNPQYSCSNCRSVDDPCFTLIARMDKKPPYIVTTQTGKIAIQILNTDSKMTIKIKEFMALYGIVDIMMRMLKIPELKRIMGFPANYKLIGSQTEQKKYIGNAVEVNMSKVLCESLVKKLLQQIRKTA